MTTSPEMPTAAWIRPVESMIRAAQGAGAFFVAFAIYRPDLVRDLAAALDYDVVDFRANYMQQHGWDAGKLGTGALTKAIEAHAGPRGLILQNAEALLATKTAAERYDWFIATIIRHWPRPVIVPVAVFQADLPPSPGRFHRVDPSDVTEPSMIYRLATQ